MPLLISRLNEKLIVINSGITFYAAREEKQYSRRHAYFHKCLCRFLYSQKSKMCKPEKKRMRCDATFKLEVVRSSK